ncbi:DUF4097 family beta strand repeat-containing protein [Nocardioides sp.]|uniref:DUF4097 family beta strand repeat-containing protein n=1 Tax=Nocardioides sp. TaxID=35761 RepID=UPI002ED43C98
MTEYDFSTPEPLSLYVEIGAGQVDVTATDTAESRVELSGRHADEVVVELDGRNLRVVAPKRRAGFFTNDDSLFATITVPSRSDLAVRTGSADLGVVGEISSSHVKTGSGDVRLDILSGQSTVETGSGDVEIEDAGSALRVKCGSGDVRINSIRSGAAVSTGSGDVQIGASHGPAVVKTGSGDVRVVEADSDVSLVTGSGDLQIDTARRGKFSAKGASGSIHVGIPAGTPVWTDISTVSGRIHSNVEGGGEPTDGADHIELRATTVSGDVVLSAC